MQHPDPSRYRFGPPSSDYVVCSLFSFISNLQTKSQKITKIAKKKYLHTDERDSQHRSWPGDPKTSEHARYGRAPIVLICYLYLMNTIRPPCEMCWYCLSALSSCRQRSRWIRKRKKELKEDLLYFNDDSKNWKYAFLVVLIKLKKKERPETYFANSWQKSHIFLSL